MLETRDRAEGACGNKVEGVVIKYATAQGGMEKKERRERQGVDEESMKAINKADTVIQRTFLPPFVWVKDSRRPSLAGNPSTIQENNGEGRNVHPPPPPRDPL